MTEFTSEEFHLIGTSLEAAYYSVAHNGEKVAVAALQKKVAIAAVARQIAVPTDAENLADGMPELVDLKYSESATEPVLSGDTVLKVGQPCRILKPGHHLDGKRAILERILNNDGKIRIWVISGIATITEVPSNCLVECP